MVLLLFLGVGTTAPYEFRDDDGRDYICRWDTKLGGHVIRVPASLWTANNHKMAKSCMERRRPRFALVVSVELAEQSVREADAEAPGLAEASADPISVIETNESPEDAPVEVIQIGGVPLREVIASLVADGAMRIKTIVATIGGDVTEEQIKTALSDPECRVKLASGWVSLPNTTP